MKFSIIPILLFAALPLSAQWNTNGSAIYYNSGYVGIGTISPQAIFHTSSSLISLSSTQQYGANLIIEGKGSSRDTNYGSSIGFVVPANTDGSNPWQQGRIIVTPDNTYNYNARGRMYLQARGWNGSAWHWNNNLVLNADGNVGVGTENIGSFRLAVNGTIGAKEVKVTSSGWSDFVFKPDYDLPSLQEVQDYINQNGHLPDIPAAEEVKADGISLGEMDTKLLQKIEELTLYILNQEDRISNLENENQELKSILIKIIQE